MFASPVTPPASFLSYNRAWNTDDPSRVRAFLERAVTPDVEFVDPQDTETGIDALEALIVRARERYPSAKYLLTSGIDGQKGRYRYTWEAQLGDRQVLPGFDVVFVDSEERIRRIDGFFGALPALTDTD